MEKFAAIDFETANWQQTSVCSVGIVVMNRGVIEDRFYSLIHPAPNFYSRRNTAIHGLSREDTEEALAFPTVWREIAPMIEGHVRRGMPESCLSALRNGLSRLLLLLYLPPFPEII